MILLSRRLSVTPISSRGFCELQAQTTTRLLNNFLYRVEGLESLSITYFTQNLRIHSQNLEILFLSLIISNQKVEKAKETKNQLVRQLKLEPENKETLKTAIATLKLKIKKMYEKINNKKFMKKLKKIEEINNHDIKSLNDLLNRGIFEKPIIRKADEDQILCLRNLQ